MADPLVIIGAGQAASQLMASLAQDGFAGEVCLVGDEPHLPYQRPPLSKKFLAGELALDRLYVKPAAFYEKAGSRLLLGQRAERIDREGRAVILADGSRLSYSTLVLATGSRPRELPLPGAGLSGAFYLRSIADVDAIRARLARAKSLVVIGGGYIGLELAAVAAKLGLGVTVLEQAPRLMARGVGPVVSRVLRPSARRGRRRHPHRRGRARLRGQRGDRARRLRRRDVRRRHRRHRRRCGAQRRACPRSRDWRSTMASWSTRSAAPTTLRSGPSATAPASITTWSAGACGWNRCTTRWSRRALRQRRSADASRRPCRCRGSGPTSTT